MVGAVYPSTHKFIIWQQDLQLYWGDIHTHSSYSFDAHPDALSAAQSLEYARYTAKLDFVALTDHAEGLAKTSWDEIVKQCDLANESGNFVAFAGFEWSYSAGGDGNGHKNVIFKDSNVIAYPISSAGNFAVTHPNDLWESLSGYEYITIPHHTALAQTTAGNFMYTDWSYVYSENQPLVEIYSVHGNSEVAGVEESLIPFLAESSVESALMHWLNTGDPGYKLGIVASTDNHLGKPGSVEELPENLTHGDHGYTGGLVAVYASSKTRADIFDALVAKRTYATSGPRIELSFSASNGASTVMMGETLNCRTGDSVQLNITAYGDTAAIDKIQLIRNGVVIREEPSSTLTVTENVIDDRAYYKVKVFQVPTLRWDNKMIAERAWSSPIWVEVEHTNKLFLYLPAIIIRQ